MSFEAGSADSVIFPSGLFACSGELEFFGGDCCPEFVAGRLEAVVPLGVLDKEFLGETCAERFAGSDATEVSPAR